MPKIYESPDGGITIYVREAGSTERSRVILTEDGKERTVLSLKPHLSPIKAAVIPLKRNNEDLVENAKNLKNTLQNQGLGRVLLENSGNIGKSYRKHDEIGTPICITVDFDSLEKNIVTIRNRDTMEQTKMNIDMIADFFVDYYK